ncbi:alpha/beta hydrolase [Octadecabacter ascidiaceicola]|uniref:Thermostable monoacylglycerol lipase n=1 Tax=Octadecabacter ascidiaceicola TaxID=1655543 RepID=A0A238K422_9RHOB|nr:alpha/beta fold hydrolase [Octadecabacter ascidiaceicola]SMX37639.1 Thermostable monoacylglycerol lipase [Octadecabacter ascidiaceicola]
MLPELNEIDAWLADHETAVGDVRDGCEKQIVWADQPAKKPLCILYVHGFSATAAEVRPLPDIVAKALGANLYFARLTGHGQDGEAMGRARLSDWEDDVDEALQIGAAIGDEVVVIGCSTGCTLLTTALARGARAKGIIHLSPNYGLRHRLAQLLLDLPGVRRWGPLIAGKETSFEAISDEHAALWTIKYDTQAVFTMGDAVRSCLASEIEAIQTPAYFAFNEDDRVVSPKRTRAVMARWAGPVTQDILVQGPSDDKDGHVMAGDVFSPNQTAPLAERIIAWAKAL